MMPKEGVSLAGIFRVESNDHLLYQVGIAAKRHQYIPYIVEKGSLNLPQLSWPSRIHKRLMKSRKFWDAHEIEGGQTEQFLRYRSPVFPKRRTGRAHTSKPHSNFWYNFRSDYLGKQFGSYRKTAAVNSNLNSLTGRRLTKLTYHILHFLTKGPVTRVVQQDI